MSDEAGELHDKAVVEPQLLAQPVAVGEAGVLPHHVIDRIADKVEQRERDQRHRQHDQRRLEQPLNDERDHRSNRQP